MPNPLRWGDTPFIADTTTWAKLRIAPEDAREDFRAAAEQGLVVGSPVVRLEFLHHQRGHQEFDRADARFAALPSLPITPEICEVAVQAMRDLRHAGSPGNHRVMAPDALIAATAALNEVNVLHDDGHYEKLQTVLAFESKRFGPYR